ncbi:MAG TPA: FKBP-type peptidyl-prolyl cis-trans isomerase [Rubricoccaceae bacterium]|jgi:peptidylprolyl isomerase
MAQATAGDTVHIHYTGTLADGSEFDSSRGREPLRFTLGAGQVVPGFDRAVAGMAEGETQTVTIPAAEAYGEHDPENTLVVPAGQLPPGVTLGDRLALGTPDGGQVAVTVTALDAEGATLDANHDLAGKDLTFEITLVRIG